MTEPKRCAWAPLGIANYLAYHDEEWGVPVHDDVRLFEMLTLEGAQAGLSWSTILNKREGYRRAFAGFDPAKVARFTPAKIERLLQDPSIVRNRAKVVSTVANAKATLKVQREHGSLDAYLWSFVEGKPIVNRWKRMGEDPRRDRRVEGHVEGAQGSRVRVRRARRSATRSCKRAASSMTTRSPASGTPSSARRRERIAPLPRQVPRRPAVQLGDAPLRGSRGARPDRSRLAPRRGRRSALRRVRDPLVAVAILALALLARSLSGERRRGRTLRRWARDRDFPYRASPRIPASIRALPSFAVRDAAVGIRSLVTVPGGVPILAFHRWTEPFGSVTVSSSTVAVAFELAAACPKTYVQPRGFVQLPALGMEETLLESPDVRRRYHVLTDEPRFASALLDQRFLAWMESLERPITFETGGRWAMLSSDVTAPDAFDRLVDEVRELLARIPRDLTSLYPAVDPGHLPGRLGTS